MNIPFLDLAWQEKHIKEDREKRFAETINATRFVLGPDVLEFEKQFEEYIGVEHVVGVAGGTQALTMIFRSLGMTPTDEILMTPSTFIASAGAVLHAGAKPIFAEMDPKTRDFDYDTLDSYLTPNTKIILAVHLYGRPCDMDKLQVFAIKHSLLIVEDAAQAHGARYKGKRVGTFGVAAAFSFYPGKNLGAYGDGGAVVTSSLEIADAVRKMRNQGCATKYDHELLGYNSRLDALQADVLSAKLPFLDAWNALRASIAERYNAAFAELPLSLPPIDTDHSSVWHLYVMEVHRGTRDIFMKAMQDKGVATGIHYPVALHLTPALKYLGIAEGTFPRAEQFAKNIVSLPVYPGMTDEQVQYVIESVKEYFYEV